MIWIPSSAGLLTDMNMKKILNVRKAGRRVPGILCLHQTISIGKEEPADLGGHDTLLLAAFDQRVIAGV